MHAYLITGQDKELVENNAQELITKEKAKRLDFPLQKIADMTDLRKFVNLSLNEKTAIVIDSIDAASIDAQNAFLKSLEEPQKNLIYILTANSEDSVLPTIASRCQVIKVNSKINKPDEETKKKIENFLKMSVGQRLSATSKIAKREDAKEFLQDFISVEHEFIKERPQIALYLDGALKTLNAINKNGNVQIQLTNFVVGMAT